MEIMDLEYITVCQECGCVFDFTLAIKFEVKRNGNQITVCPACKHEYELPKTK